MTFRPALSLPTCDGDSLDKPGLGTAHLRGIQEQVCQDSLRSADCNGPTLFHFNPKNGRHLGASDFAHQLQSVNS